MALLLCVGAVAMPAIAQEDMQRVTHARDAFIPRQFDAWVFDTEHARYLVEVRQGTGEVAYETARGFVDGMAAQVDAFLLEMGAQPEACPEVYVLAYNGQGGAMTHAAIGDARVAIPMAPGYVDAVLQGVLPKAAPWVLSGLCMVLEGEAAEEDGLMQHIGQTDALPGVAALYLQGPRAEPYARAMATALVRRCIERYGMEGILKRAEGLAFEEVLSDWQAYAGVTAAMPDVGHVGGHVRTDEMHELIYSHGGIRLKVKRSGDDSLLSDAGAVYTLVDRVVSLRLRVWELLAQYGGEARKTDEVLTVVVDMSEGQSARIGQTQYAYVWQDQVFLSAGGLEEMTLAHELVHTYLPHEPRWLSEGLADYIAGVSLGLPLQEVVLASVEMIGRIQAGETVDADGRRAELTRWAAAYYDAAGVHVLQEAVVDPVLYWDAGAYVRYRMSVQDGDEAAFTIEEYGEGLAQTYDLARSFVPYLVERFSLETVLKAAAAYEGSEAAFGVEFEELVGDWTVELLGMEPLHIRP